MGLTDILGWSFFVLFGIWALIFQPRREIRRRDAARRRWVEEREQVAKVGAAESSPRWDELKAILAKHLELPAEYFRPEDTLALLDELDHGEVEWLGEAAALWGVRSPQRLLLRSKEPVGEMTLRMLCERFAAGEEPAPKRKQPSPE